MVDLSFIKKGTNIYIDYQLLAKWFHILIIIGYYKELYD